MLWPVLPATLLCRMVILILRERVGCWLRGEQKFDEDAIIEWVREARPDKTLPERVREYLELSRKVSELTKAARGKTEDPFSRNEPLSIARNQFDLKQQEIKDRSEEHTSELQSLRHL